MFPIGYIPGGGVAPATDSARTTGWLICYGENGQPSGGIDIEVQLLKTATQTAGSSFSSAKRKGTSAEGTGRVEFPNLRRLATYRVWRGPRYIDWMTSDADTSAIDEVIGEP